MLNESELERACDVAEECSGSSKECPEDRKHSASTICRPADPEMCDVAEFCDGSSNACPDDVVAEGNWCGMCATCDDNRTCSATQANADPHGDCATYRGCDGVRACHPWTQQFGTKGKDTSRGVAVDGKGGVYVAGDITGSTRSDMLLIKYDAAGDQKWMRQFGTEHDEWVRSVATDGQGGIYVVGVRYEVDGHEGKAVAVVVKYTEDGVERWTKRIETAEPCYGEGVAADGNGDVYVMGDNFRPSGDPDRDIFVAKYAAVGYWEWKRQFGTLPKGEGAAISLDGKGGFYVVGEMTVGLATSTKTRDGFVIKYDEDGDEKWRKLFSTPEFDVARAVAADGNGNVYVVGSTNGNLKEGEQNAGESDAFIAKYGEDGAKHWMLQFGTAEADGAVGVATDGYGGVYVVGNTDGDLDGNTNANDDVGLFSTADVFVVKYDEDGDRKWTRLVGTQQHEFSAGIATDGGGAVYVTGTSGGGLDGNSNAGADDVFLVRFTSEGVRL